MSAPPDPAPDPSRIPGDRDRRVVLAVLLLLFATGWAANHFVALLPVLIRQQGFSVEAVDAAFGIYALGILPGLMSGGWISDRVGRRWPVLIGASVAGLGNLVMASWHTEAGVYLCRLIVGIGVGVAMSAGTAWTSELAGRVGAVRAGVALTAGFGTGPLVSGLIAQAADSIVVSFLVSGTLSAAAIAVAAVATRGRGRRPEPARSQSSPAVADPNRTARRHVPARPVPGPSASGHTMSRALTSSLPMAAWVFASVSVPIVALVARLGPEFRGPWVPGVAAALTLGTGVGVQVLARRFGWGPAAGVAGALLAAVGFVVAATIGTSVRTGLLIALCVVFGAAYGLCLQQGLLDVETFCPAEARGLCTGIFYVVAYLGFGLPLLLAVVDRSIGAAPVLIALAVLALLAAAARLPRLRRS